MVPARQTDSRKRASSSRSTSGIGTSRPPTVQRMPSAAAVTSPMTAAVEPAFRRAVSAVDRLSGGQAGQQGAGGQQRIGVEPQRATDTPALRQHGHGVPIDPQSHACRLGQLVQTRRPARLPWGSCMAWTSAADRRTAAAGRTEIPRRLEPRGSSLDVRLADPGPSKRVGLVAGQDGRAFDGNLANQHQRVARGVRRRYERASRVPRFPAACPPQTGEFTLSVISVCPPTRATPGPRNRLRPPQPATPGSDWPWYPAGASTVASSQRGSAPVTARSLPLTASR